MTTPAPPKDNISNKEGIVSPSWILWFLQIRRKIDDVIQEDSTHITSAGTSHSHVVLNDAHRISDGSDHSIVGTNQTAIAALQASEITNSNAITLNTNHRVGGGADHSGVSQNTANIEALMQNTQVVTVLLGENMSKGDLFYLDMPVATVKGYTFDITTMDYKDCCGILTADGSTDDYVTGILFGGCFYWSEKVGTFDPQNVLYVQSDSTLGTTETDYFAGVVIEKGFIHLNKNRGDELELINVNIADIATNAADIATNEADIATNEADIATNVTNISTNADDIDDLEADVAVINDVIPYRDFTLGENISSGKLVWAYDDSGTAKIKECVDHDDLRNTYASGSDHDTCKITDDIVCTVYADTGNSSYGTVVLSTVTEGNLLEDGSPHVWLSSAVANVEVEYITTNTILIKYTDMGRMRAIAGTISGDTFTFGSVSSLSAGAVSYTTMTKTKDGMCVLSWYLGSIISIPLTVSGTTITAGSYLFVSTTVSGAWGLKIKTAGVDDKYVYYYENGTMGMSRLGTVNGTGSSATITMSPMSFFTTGGAVTLHDIVNVSPNVMALIVKGYAAVYFGNYGQTLISILDLTASTLTHGSFVPFFTGTLTGASGCKGNADNKFLINYTYSGSSTVVEMTVVGNSASPGDPIEYKSTAYVNPTSVTLYNNRYILGGSMATYGYLFVYDEDNVTNGNTSIGILNETGTTGQTKPVVMHGSVTDSLSSLEIGKKYYYASDLSIGLTKTNLMIGIAISATELLLIKS